MQTVALIVAAGKGERFGSAVPKQYACLGGIPILTRSIRAFVEHSRIDAVRVVALVLVEAVTAAEEAVEFVDEEEVARREAAAAS